MRVRVGFPVILSLNTGVEANVYVGAQTGTVATEVLPEQDGGKRRTRDTGCLGSDIQAKIQKRRPGFLIVHRDQENGTIRDISVVSNGIVRVVASVRSHVR